MRFVARRRGNSDADGARVVQAGLPLCVMLAGCGHGAGGNEAADNGSDNEQVAAAATPAPLDCPSRFDVPAAPAGAPQDSIGGLRPGGPLDQAVLFIRCQDKSVPYEVGPGGGGFTLDAGDEKIRQVTDLIHSRPATKEEIDKNQRARSNDSYYNRQYLAEDSTHVTDHWTLFALGRAKAERVEGIWHTQYYDEGKMPPAADVGKALVAKYGPPSQLVENAGGASMIWMYDTYGRKMTEQTPGFANCSSAVAASYGHLSATPDCGLTIAAAVTKADKNELLAKSLAVGVTNPSTIADSLDTLKRQFKSDDDARKQRELNNAGAAKTDVKL